MKNIRIAKDVTWKEVNDHVDAISFKAEEIARMSDKHAVLVQLRALRDFERKDNYDLNLVRNHDIVMNTPALWAYSFYFGHLHFIDFNEKNISWNADEFNQAKRGYEIAKPEDAD
ncbi:hypothetical protein [Lactiplantibacillus plantarum]|uniref:hypothetical protein n=1 Tax=Lactiplantibacillus plantarum TaxID=1590 RepID=UPI00217E578C|nr:hypothetical protein [Lactiplantibacillus plantarum]UWF30251.1 hypothetical protein NYR27_09410 [Lactiplantibacillus plantarum]UWF40309.1 hypothetical protein NYR28_06095 [Lactiplantibacillus plantarum]UWF43308.1 hypothetical protein NYR31_06105 [Lactiplantibacillus plantarum]